MYLAAMHHKMKTLLLKDFDNGGHFLSIDTCSMFLKDFNTYFTIHSRACYTSMKWIVRFEDGDGKNKIEEGEEEGIIHSIMHCLDSLDQFGPVI